ncbi:MAG: hypothetical protein N4J56_007732 [Chroococcidiopsis sp. SAG 2025]|uniref:CHAT domain-containing protein n=1 Tax=Chroococcidiopsis sp. SAG 2025 TaxID=171389 RepID=UPI002937474A|nr:tetratricopeptide repeat protein [Chroococcidiopsis sp. SAG 2025]MDV2998027.1 hypothetical protein [Chroococcidiopsis sp. SAG 2025]
MKQHPFSLFSGIAAPRNEARQFLRTVLQQISQYQGNAQQIYPIWAKYPERFNEMLLEAISVETSLSLGAERETQLNVSLMLFSFSRLIKSFSQGDHAINLELAIAALLKILPIISKESFPNEWARTVNNLALAYHKRIRGEWAENLEQAIELYQQALQVRTREQFPLEWAATVTHLALAYSKRIRGEQAENLEQAIELYQQALQVSTREQFPLEWARTVNNLANAYFDRIRGERAENLEQAIKLYQQALQVSTREQFPVEWTTTVNNLANAYSDRIRGERAENLEQAIELFQQVLQVRTREQFPVEWATIVSNLATAYFKRIRGEQAENLEQAIELYQQALQVYTPESFPSQCYLISKDLGFLGFNEGDWEVAIEGFAIAIKAVERSRSWATNETSRQQIQAGASAVYTRMVQACINTGKLNLALETVERSRSKRLVELMSINDFYQEENTPDEVQSYLQQYEALQRQIDNLRLDFKMASEPTLVGAESSRRSRAAWGAVDHQHIQELEQQKQTMRQQLSRLDPVSAGLLEVRALNLSELQQLIDRPNTALLSFYSIGDSSHIFVLRQNQLTYHSCPYQGNALLAWLNDRWLWAYLGIQLADNGAIQRLPQSSWKSNLPAVLAELSQRLQIEDLIQNHLQAIDELILIPHLGLHQIPFAALPTSQGLLGDRFTLRVVPSCQVLQFCHQRPPLTSDLLGLIEDASGDLPCSSFEAESVATLYNVSPGLRLRGPQEATVSNYKRLLQEQQIQMLLSCHHAQSRLDNPLESKLELADGAITLGELLSLPPGGCRN